MWAIRSVRVFSCERHNHDIIYLGRCPKICCNDHNTAQKLKFSIKENHLGEPARRISERELDKAGRSSNSHLLKHYVESEHRVLDMNDYKIIEKGHKNNARKQKITEALLIREMKSTLNEQDNPNGSFDIRRFKIYMYSYCFIVTIPTNDFNNFIILSFLL